MDRKRGISFDQRGVTFVELLVTGAVGVIVAGAVFYFVGFAGDGTSYITGQQQLEQESAIISELFMRTIRNGRYVCANSDTVAPALDANSLSRILVRGAKSNGADSTIATFEISGDTLSMNGDRYLTAYLCNLSTPASHFKVFQNGKHAEFYLSMWKKAGKDTIRFTQTMGVVRCKN